MSSFSLYDTFGYFIPGTTFVIGFYVFLEIIGFNQEFNTKGYFDAMTQDFPTFFAVFPVLGLFVYVLGHFIASISTVIMDKLLMERTLGYPFRRLFYRSLDWEKSDRLRYLHRNRTFYKSIVASSIISVSFNFMGANWWYVYFLSIAIFFLVFKSLFSLLSLEDIRDPDSLREGGSKRLRCAEIIWHIFKPSLILFYASFDLAIYLLLYLFRMCKPFEKKFQDKFSTKFKKTFGITVEEAGTNVYWLTYSYIQQNEENSVPLIQNWLNLYSLSRNISTVLLILFFCGLYPEMIFKDANTAILDRWLICTGIGAIVFWLRYYYLYYNYYSKYIFRAFLTSRI